MSDKKSCVRHVFGRVTVRVEGRQYRFEMHRDGIMIRRAYSRTPVTVSFTTLLDRLKMQSELPLQPALPMRNSK